MHTMFFDFTVTGAYLAEEYEGYQPAEGNQLLVADITVKNTFRESIEMYDTDFQGPDGRRRRTRTAYSIPITTDPETFTELEPVGGYQLPGTYPLAVDEERSGQLVYEVPQGYVDFSLSYLELYDDGSEEENTGDTYFVFFTAQDAP